jgi:hypothetical protein
MSGMRWTLASLILCLVALAGCQMRQSGDDERTTVVTAPPPAPTPVPDETLARFQRLAPDALVGRVVAGLPEYRLVKVGEIPIENVRVGDSVVFYGAGELMLGGGTVVDIVNKTLHVQYPEPSGHRAPTTGDMAVLFKK